MRDVESHGQTVTAGSAMLMLVAAANRDESRYPDGDRFDIHRKGPPHVTFGRGVHACLGAALARVEGRVALDELLKRFPTWTVDLDNAKLSSTSTVRGWDNLPALVGGASRKATQREAIPETTQQAAANAAPSGEVWELTLSTPVGPQVMTARILRNGNSFSGTISNAELGDRDITGQVSGNTLTWTLAVTKPVAIKLGFEATVEGDELSGQVKLGMFGKAALTGKRV
jgi:hypothetical protein